MILDYTKNEIKAEKYICQALALIQVGKKLPKKKIISLLLKAIQNLKEEIIW